MMSKTELHSQTRCYLRHIYLHVQCKRIRFRSVGCNYMHTRKQNDNYKRWRRRKQLLITQGACTQSAEELPSPVGVTEGRIFAVFTILNNIYVPKDAERPGGNQLWTIGGGRWFPCGGNRPFHGGTTRRGDKFDCECKIWSFRQSVLKY